MKTRTNAAFLRALRCVLRQECSACFLTFGEMLIVSAVFGWGMGLMLSVLLQEAEMRSLSAFFVMLAAEVFAFGRGAGLFGLTMRLACQMGQPRRHALAACWAAGLMCSAGLLLIAAAMDGVWRVLAASGTIHWLGRIPALGWAALWVLPTALNSICMALRLRFGRRADWGLGALFVAVCLTVGAAPDLLGEEAFFAALRMLPSAGLLLSAVSLAAGGKIWQQVDFR